MKRIVFCCCFFLVLGLFPFVSVCFLEEVLRWLFFMNVRFCRRVTLTGEAAGASVPAAGDDWEANGVVCRFHVLGGLNAPPVPSPTTLWG